MSTRIRIHFALSLLGSIALAAMIAHLIEPDVLLSRLSWTSAALFAVAGCAHAHRAAGRPGDRLWATMTLACSAWVGAQLLFNLFAVIGTPPSPTPADLLWLAFPLIAGAGLHGLVPMPDRGARRLAVLETILLTAGVGALCVAALHGPLSLGAVAPREAATALAYAVFYALVPVIMVQALLAGALSVLRAPDLALLLLGVALEAIAFIAWTPLILEGRYDAPAPLVDLLWSCGLLAIGCGAMNARSRPAPRVDDFDRQLSRGLLPALIFASLMLGAVLASISDAPRSQRLIIDAGAVGVGVLLAARTQLLARSQHGLLAERERAADSLVVLNAELRHRAAKLESSNADLSQFAHVAAHDISEPLRSVAGFAELLERRHGSQLEPGAKRFLRHIVDGAERTRILIDDLLRYTQVLSHEPDRSWLAPGEAAREAWAELGGDVRRRGAELEVGVLPRLWADPEDLRRLFGDLFENAVRFTPDVAPRVRVDAVRADGAWCLSVSDNGIGIPPQHADRVFGIFERLHGQDAFPGTGIGLAICRRVIELHGGRIWAEARAGGGTRVSFELPDGPVESVVAWRAGLKVGHPGSDGLHDLAVPVASQPPAAAPLTS